MYRGDRPRTLELPGLAIKLIPGPGAVEGDTPYKGFFLASQSRWLLENLATGRGAQGERTLSQDVLESELDKKFFTSWDNRFNQLRDVCRTLR